MAKSAPPPPPPDPVRDRWARVFGVVLGLFLGLALVKFGNPVILEDLIAATPESLANLHPSTAARAQAVQKAETKADWTEDVYRPWPMHWGLWGIGALALFALRAGERKDWTPHRFLLLLVAWWSWQFVCAAFSVNVTLSQFTLIHFSGAALCLFLGWYGLTQSRQALWLWAGLLIGLVMVLWNGFNQHYGGLEATRRFIYEETNWRQLPPEFLKRVASNRIYSTLVYPNALAGAILLFLPPALTALWRMTRALPKMYRGVLVGLLLYLGLACLVWSGSKAGWLIALVLGMVALFQTPLPRQVRVLVLYAIVVLGLAGFLVHFAPYFQRGATSVSARFDYWHAALVTAAAHPLTGTGPGTFSVPYKQIKAPESEMARLAHNDYLEQASDSGVPGLLAFFGLVGGSLLYLYRQRQVRSDGLRFATWLGLLGWAIQGCVEFGLYIPALTWPAFTFLGWLLATPPNPMDRPGLAQYRGAKP